MQRIIHMLRGKVRLEIEGAFPERFLNLLAQHGVAFWGLEWRSPLCLRLYVSRRAAKGTAALAERAMCTSRVLGRQGLPFLLARFRRRYALIFGLLLSLAAVLVLSRFVLEVTIEGNETVPSAQIRAVLSELGVRPFVWGPSIDSGQVEQELLLRIPELGWFAVNVNGCRAEVSVREREKKPDLIDEKTPANVVAEKGGIVTRLEVLEGAAQIGRGDTVAPGDLLISGVDDLEAPPAQGGIVGVRYVHAMGRVYARTWYTLSAATPLDAFGKSYTGAERTRRALILGNKQINFYLGAGISYGKYDKIEKTKTLVLPGGMTLPVSLLETTLTEYEAVPAQVARASAEAYLRRVLEEELRARVGEGEILRMSVTVSEQDGVLTVTLLGECEEQIGAARALVPEEEAS